MLCTVYMSSGETRLPKYFRGCVIYCSGCMPGDSLQMQRIKIPSKTAFWRIFSYACSYNRNWRRKKYEKHQCTPALLFFSACNMSPSKRRWIDGRRDLITINVPAVFMAQYVMVLRGATSLQGALEGVGPKKLRFSGPTPSNAPRNDVAPLKTIPYRAIKINWYIGSFMYPSAVV